MPRLIRQFFRLFWLVLFVGVVLYLNKPKPTPPPTPENKAKDAPTDLAKGGETPPGPGVAAKLPNSVELATTASLQKQQVAVAKFNQRQALAAFDQLRLALDAWEKELQAWEKEGPPLLKNEEGKLIASDPVEVNRFRGAIRQERPNRIELASERTLADVLIMPIREALENPDDASTPSPDLTERIQSTQARASRARESYRDGRAAVRAMLAKVKAASAPPSSVTLEAAISALDQDEASGRAAAIADAEKKAKDEGAAHVAVEKARLAKEVLENEAAELANRVAMKKQETEFANARSVEQMKVRQKEAEAHIAHLEDVAEQQRIGNLKSGSKWKGQFNYNGYPPDLTILTIRARTKDDIQGVATYAGTDTIFTFAGKVVGTRLKLNVLQMSGFQNQTLDLMYQPSTKTITGNMLDAGGRPVAAITVRLMEEKEN